MPLLELILFLDNQYLKGLSRLRKSGSRSGARRIGKNLEDHEITTLSVHGGILEHKPLGLLPLILSPLLFVLEFHGVANSRCILAGGGDTCIATHHGLSHGHGRLDRAGVAGIGGGQHTTIIYITLVRLSLKELRALRARIAFAFH